MTDPTVTSTVPARTDALPPTLHGHSSYAGELVRPTEVWDDPARPNRVVAAFGERNENGVPTTFLIQGERAVGVTGVVWYHVLLPIRPNGTHGWVRAADVRVIGMRYRLEVHLEAFRVDLFDGDRLVESIEIGVGEDQTPTPGGTYYIKELLRPPDQDTLYGHYVFGLSGFSNVLLDWPGGGVLGIHGTNEPESIGSQVSHGCVRMRNEDITRLAALLPIGTPVTVSA